MSDKNKSLPIIDLASNLTLEINREVVKFPRHQRPGLGRRIEAAAFDLLTALVQACYLQSADPARDALLVQASQSLDTLRLLIRMAKDLTHLPIGRYEELSRSLREVGRMLGGWQKSVRRCEYFWRSGWRSRSTSARPPSNRPVMGWTF